MAQQERIIATGRQSGAEPRIDDMILACRRASLLTGRRFDAPDDYQEALRALERQT